jgi:hypothetical protein
MSRLEDAQRRLEHALERLEAATRQRDAGASADLVRALEDANRRQAALDARQREIGVRLDAAIGRLRTVLNG